MAAAVNSVVRQGFVSECNLHSLQNSKSQKVQLEESPFFALCRKVDELRKKEEVITELGIPSLVVPSIDLRQCSLIRAEPRALFFKHVREVLCSVGLFTLKNSGLTLENTKEILDSIVRSYFSIDKKEKEPIFRTSKEVFSRIEGVFSSCRKKLEYLIVSSLDLHTPPDLLSRETVSEVHLLPIPSVEKKWEVPDLNNYFIVFPPGMVHKICFSNREERKIEAQLQEDEPLILLGTQLSELSSRLFFSAHCFFRTETDEPSCKIILKVGRKN